MAVVSEQTAVVSEQTAVASEQTAVASEQTAVASEQTAVVRDSVSQSVCTIVEGLHIAHHFLQTGLGVVEGGQANIPLHLGPGGQLVHGPLRALDLSWLHG